MRKGLCIIICALLVMSCNAHVHADEIVPLAAATVPSISPLMEYIAGNEAGISVDSNGLATISCKTCGYIGITTRVEITADLQRYDNGRWITINRFAAASDSHRVSLNHTHILATGYTYRVQATVTAYSGTSVEVDVITSGTVLY